jgi:hypothetical protein
MHFRVHNSLQSYSAGVRNYITIAMQHPTTDITPFHGKNVGLEFGNTRNDMSAKYKEKYT